MSVNPDVVLVLNRQEILNRRVLMQDGFSNNHIIIFLTQPELSCQKFRN